MKKCKKKNRLTPKKAKRPLIAFRATPSERDMLEGLASIYCNGNVSEWVLHASLNYAPKKGEFK